MAPETAIKLKGLRMARAFYVLGISKLLTNVE